MSSRVLLFIFLLPVAAVAAVDFSTQIYPVLQKACLECHGASEGKGDLRLHSKEAFARADVNELLRRVALPRSDKQAMPKRGTALTPSEIDLLKAWVHEGAPWPESLLPGKHWAYVPPQRPPLPTVKAEAWCRQPVDRFVLAGLEKVGLTPSPDAAAATLYRRLSLDLIGLPPGLEDVARFEKAYAQDADAAVSAAVDQLLASREFGVRWARPWLDLARYADSHGFQRDDLREIWAFRDWVVDAFNADMPFDQFTIEQVAGDLLPAATSAQMIATGFHRCTPTNVEAGTEPEETRINQVIDRVNTTGAVWLGSTLECAQCHDHKYDPFSQKDYYRLLAYFNNTEKEAERTNPKTPGSIQFKGVPLALQTHRQADLAQSQELLAKKSALEEQIAELDEGKVPARLKKQVQALERRLKDVKVPTTEVMRELPEPRMTTVFKRGVYTDHGEPVQAGIPSVFASSAKGPPHRLTLAQWLVSRDNPLAARVTVNRWWAELFGRGIVSTVEDFGIKGAAPTHPELLDWLAVQFMDSGWQMKALLKQIVTSRTYRQDSSQVRTLDAGGVQPHVVDPENTLLWHGPRHRLDAEAIRDNALAVAGLLNLKQGGPPIRPPQPEGLWAKVGGQQYKYEVSPGTEQHRRGLYVVLKRGAPYPSFVNFDAGPRMACVVKRSRSNTPLQALTLLNDPVYVEAARALAVRLASSAEAVDVASRLRLGFRLAVAREPRPEEIRVLADLHSSQLQANNETAAWEAVATALLNLDETITKG